MTLKYDEIVPWGRSFDEYVAMFSLTKADLAEGILGCADELLRIRCQGRSQPEPMPIPSAIWIPCRA